MKAQPISGLTVSYQSPLKAMPRRCGATVLAVAALGITAWPCSIPVFRYALERWPADTYHIEIFHRGPLEPEAQSKIDQLLASTRPALPYVNAEVKTIDIEAPPAGDEEAVQHYREQSQGSADPAWVSIQYPVSSGILTTAWSGPLHSLDPAVTFDSPLRQTIADRILQGEAAVWVLMESGNRELDTAAAAMLESTLESLETTLQLPEINPADLSGDLTEIGADHGLSVHFSMVTLQYGDPNETLLRSMLLRSEPDLETDYIDRPMAFPIYGQGRALYALVGNGITEENIREACSFVIGPCSCQVKELNPGTDLLMAVNWESRLPDRVVGTIETPPLVGLAGLSAAVTPATPAVAAAVKQSEPAESVASTLNPLVRNLLVVFAVLAIATFVILLTMNRRLKSQNRS